MENLNTKNHIVKNKYTYISKLRIAVINNKKDKAYTNSLNVINSKSKRFFDLLISVPLFFLVFSWVLIIIATIIKLSSKGPVFFKQKRIGLNAEIFICYKFRTMYVEKILPKYTPTLAEDPRVTSFGRFLRKSNLDELPQLINVILGNMTIVGPRPHAIAFHEKYSKFIGDINKRLMVKPGITGLAQIRGFRGDVINEEENKKRTIKRVAFDILYIKKWTLGLDVYILIVTAKQMLFRKTNGH